MRVVIVGDFHLDPKNLAFTEAAMEDVKNARPDLVVALGDFGTSAQIGTPEGIAQAHFYLKQTGVPVRPILGNHDLQEESAGKALHGGMEAVLRKSFDLDASAGFMEFESYRFLFVTTEPQPAESCWQVQECYVSDAQFAAIQAGLASRPGVPVVVFSHAPPLGCGLRTVHRSHVRATNAYLDQNHSPQRWRTLYRENPDIVLWFSGHYHLGHHFEDSQTNRFGVLFFHTHVHGPCTRDRTRQSRVLDIGPEGATVSTIDHVGREVTGPDWRGGPLWSLRGGNRSDGPWPIRIGGGATEGNGLFRIDEKRVLLNTGEGYLWEIDLESESVLGPLHWGCPVTTAAVSGEIVWWAWGGHLAWANAHSPDRFARSYSFDPAEKSAHTLPEPVKSLVSLGNGRVLAVTGSALWLCDPVTEPSAVRTFGPEFPLRDAAAVEGGCLVLTAKGGLHRVPAEGGTPEPMVEEVAEMSLSFDRKKLTVLSPRGVEIFLREKGGWVPGGVFSLSETADKPGCLVSVFGDRWAFAIGRNAFLIGMNGRLIKEWTAPARVEGLLSVQPDRLALPLMAAFLDPDGSGRMVLGTGDWLDS